MSDYKRQEFEDFLQKNDFKPIYTEHNYYWTKMVYSKKFFQQAYGNTVYSVLNVCIDLNRENKLKEIWATYICKYPVLNNLYSCDLKNFEIKTTSYNKALEFLKLNYRGEAKWISPNLLLSEAKIGLLESFRDTIYFNKTHKEGYI